MARTGTRTRAFNPYNRPVPVVVVPTKRPRQKPSGQPKPTKPPICKVVVPKLPAMSKKNPSSHQSRPEDISTSVSDADSETCTPSPGCMTGKPVDLAKVPKTRPQRDAMFDDNLDEQAAPDRHHLEQDTRSESGHQEPDRHAGLMDSPLGSQPSESTLEYIDQPPSSSPAPDMSQLQLPPLAHRSSGYDDYDQPGHLNLSKPTVSRSSSRDSGHTVHAPHHAREDASDHDDRYSIPLDRDGLPVSSQRRPPAGSDDSDPFGFSKAERVLQEYRAKGHTIQLAAHAPKDVWQPPRKIAVPRDGAGKKRAEGNDAQPESDLSLTDLLPIPKSRRAGKSRLEKKNDTSSKRTRKKYLGATKNDMSGSGDENNKQVNRAATRDPSEQLDRNSSLSPTRSTRSAQAPRASSSGHPGVRNPVRNRTQQGTRKPLVLKRIDPNRKINKNVRPHASKSANNNLKRQNNDSQGLEQDIISTNTHERKKRIEYYQELEDLEFEEEVVI